MILRDLLRSMPIVAILRGLPPADAESIGEALSDAGIGCAEVPLNSPEPFKSIAALRARFPEMQIGAGTVLTETDVADANAAGAQFIVSPNTDVAVVAATKRAGLCSMPGFFTPTEAFAALSAGADVLKLFPAARAGADFVRAIRDVLPAGTPIFAVGGVDENAVETFLAAGAAGFGFGSTIYKPGASPAQVHDRATALIEAVRRARG
jgi:2-dehydro-3-deoxyphosphogalactonate aldolase